MYHYASSHIILHYHTSYIRYNTSFLDPLVIVLHGRENLFSSFRLHYHHNVCFTPNLINDSLPTTDLNHSKPYSLVPYPVLTTKYPVLSRNTWPQIRPLLRMVTTSSFITREVHLLAGNIPLESDRKEQTLSERWSKNSRVRDRQQHVGAYSF